jgi:hypothetical protein
VEATAAHAAATAATDTADAAAAAAFDEAGLPRGTDLPRYVSAARMRAVQFAAAEEARCRTAAAALSHEHVDASAFFDALVIFGDAPVRAHCALPWHPCVRLLSCPLGGACKRSPHAYAD